MSKLDECGASGALLPARAETRLFVAKTKRADTAEIIHSQ